MTREYIPNPEYDAEYAASTIRPMSGKESGQICAHGRKAENPCPHCLGLAHGQNPLFSKEATQPNAKPAGLTSPIARQVMEEMTKAGEGDSK